MWGQVNNLLLAKPITKLSYNMLRVANVYSGLIQIRFLFFLENPRVLDQKRPITCQLKNNSELFHCVPVQHSAVNEAFYYKHGRLNKNKYS